MLTVFVVGLKSKTDNLHDKEIVLPVYLHDRRAIVISFQISHSGVEGVQHGFRDLQGVQEPSAASPLIY